MFRRKPVPDFIIGAFELGKIVEVEVYFGWNIPRARRSIGHRRSPQHVVTVKQVRLVISSDLLYLLCLDHEA
jgi:hypothetical protein